MVIKPIPKHLLIHSATYEEWQEGDGINTESGFKPPVALSNVRVEYLTNGSKSSLSRNSISEELFFFATLYYDVVNSRADGPFEFTNKSKVTFEGKTMHIDRVTPVHAISLHHWEVGLL